MIKKISLSSLLLISIIPAIIIFWRITEYGVFVPFMLDDIEYSYLIQKFGFWGAQLERIMWWNGRLSSNLFISISQFVFPLTGVINFTAPITLGMLFVMFYDFIKQTINLNTLERYAFSSFALIGFISFLATILSSIIWLTGTITYTWAVILFYITVRCIISYIQRPSVGFFWGIVFSLLITITMNETIALCTCLALVLLLIYYAFDKDKRIKLFKFLVATLLITTAMVLSPGNEAQKAELIKYNTNDLSFSLKYVLEIFSQMNKYGIFTPLNLSAVIPFIFLGPKIKTKFHLKEFIFLSMFLIITTVLIFFGAAWNNGTTYEYPLSPRVFAPIAFIITIFLIATSAFIGRWIIQKTKLLKFSQYLIPSTALISGAIIYYQAKHGHDELTYMRNIISDNTHKAYFHIVQTSYNAIAIDKSKEVTLYIPKILVVSHELNNNILMFSKDPRNLQNIVLAHKFDKSSVKHEIVSTREWLTSILPISKGLLANGTIRNWFAGKEQVTSQIKAKTNDSSKVAK